MPDIFIATKKMNDLAAILGIFFRWERRRLMNAPFELMDLGFELMEVGRELMDLGFGLMDLAHRLV
ncbi:hypothetical protein [Flagellimonas sp. GZD32]|uniref:hypothetical protein n=1 Tax=Flagellimonas cixiensis TaxID=3228750 RepID=UPI0035C8880C